LRAYCTMQTNRYVNPTNATRNICYTAPRRPIRCESYRYSTRPLVSYRHEICQLSSDVLQVSVIIQSRCLIPNFKLVNTSLVKNNNLSLIEVFSNSPYLKTVDASQASNRFYATAGLVCGSNLVPFIEHTVIYKLRLHPDFKWKFYVDEVKGSGQGWSGFCSKKKTCRMAVPPVDHGKNCPSIEIKTEQMGQKLSFYKEDSCLQLSQWYQKTCGVYLGFRYRFSNASYEIRGIYGITGNNRFIPLLLQARQQKVMSYIGREFDKNKCLPLARRNYIIRRVVIKLHRKGSKKRWQTSCDFQCHLQQLLAKTRLFKTNLLNDLLTVPSPRYPSSEVQQSAQNLLDYIYSSSFLRTENGQSGLPVYYQLVCGSAIYFQEKIIAVEKGREVSLFCLSLPNCQYIEKRGTNKTFQQAICRLEHLLQASLCKLQQVCNSK
jgi:hypothetical protein